MRERYDGRVAEPEARVAAATATAMTAFAANSILCRLALAGGAIDPVGFTAVRLVSGAVTLYAVVRVTRRGGGARAVLGGSWGSAAALFAYAIAFSLAYVTLSAATGALILFAAVQVTMMARGLAGGERPSALQWAGVATACGGLVWLLAPGATAPSPAGAAAMVAAGVAWGVYSLRGRGATDPLGITAGSFARAAPLALVVAALPWVDLRASGGGIALALASGAVASGLGYVVWYTALRGLTATGAATVQLTVPVLAAAGGVVLLGETFTPRLAVAGVAILGGVALTIGRPAPPGGAPRQSSTPGGASRA